MLILVFQILIPGFYFTIAPTSVVLYTLLPRKARLWFLYCRNTVHRRNFHGQNLPFGGYFLHCAKLQFLRHRSFFLVRVF